MNRCKWCEGDELYEKYHDEVWGRPVFDDKKLFEFLILEGAQAGLSWITILRRQQAYFDAFDGYDIEKIANYTEDKINSLLINEKIIRHKLKINSVVKNAKAYLKVQEEFGAFSDFLWAYVDFKPIENGLNLCQMCQQKLNYPTKFQKILKKEDLVLLVQL